MVYSCLRLSSNCIHGIPHIHWISYYWLYGGTNIHDNPIVAGWNWYGFGDCNGGIASTIRGQEMIYNLKQDIDSLKEFQGYTTAGGIIYTWYLVQQTHLSDTTKNVIKAYGITGLGYDDFENIIKILESIS